MPVMDDEFTSAYQNDSDDNNDGPVNANADPATNQVNDALICAIYRMLKCYCILLPCFKNYHLVNCCAERRLRRGSSV